MPKARADIRSTISIIRAIFAIWFMQRKTCVVRGFFLVGWFGFYYLLIEAELRRHYELWGMMRRIGFRQRFCFGRGRWSESLTDQIITFTLTALEERKDLFGERGGWSALMWMLITGSNRRSPRNILFFLYDQSTTGTSPTDWRGSHNISTSYSEAEGAGRQLIL